MDLGVDIDSFHEEVVDTGYPDRVPQGHLVLGEQLRHPSGQGGGKGRPLGSCPLIQ